MLPLLIGRKRHIHQYYVRKTGDDTTGDGSFGNPWLTITKAFATVPLTERAIVKIGAGTYAENLSLNSHNLNWVTYQAERGSIGDVIVTNDDSTDWSFCIWDGANKVKFKYLTFGAANIMSVAVVGIYIYAAGNSASNIEFDTCTIITPSDGVGHIVRWGLSFYAFNDTRSITNFSLKNCNFTQTGTDPVEAVRIRGTTGTAIVDAISISDCTANVRGHDAAFNFLNVTNLVLSNNTVTATASGASTQVEGGSFVINGGDYTGKVYGLLIGEDGLSAYNFSSAVITGATSSATTNHGMVVGGCTGVQVLGCFVNGTDNGLVIKEAVDTVVTGGIFHTVGGSASILCKAAINPHITQVVINNNAGNAALGIDVGATGTKCINVTFTDSTIICSGTAPVFSWVAANDDGGGVVDRNVYTLGGSKFGLVLADPHVNTLAELQAAWAGYGDGSNDANSTVA